MNHQSEDWQLLWKGVNELTEWFPDGMVMIGGLAVWLHAKRVMEEHLLDVSHDADFYLSLADYADLRDIEEVTTNRRLGKSQIIRDGFDYDIYVESRNNLIIPFDAVLTESIIIDGVRCASLGHLTALKMAAWDDRRGSAKGEKDARDVGRILITFSDEKSIFRVGSVSYLTDKSMNDLKSIAESPAVFLQMAHGNANESNRLQTRAYIGYERIKTAIASSRQCMSDEVPGSTGSRHGDNLCP